MNVFRDTPPVSVLPLSEIQVGEYKTERDYPGMKEWSFYVCFTPECSCFYECSIVTEPLNRLRNEIIKKKKNSDRGVGTWDLMRREENEMKLTRDLRFTMWLRYNVRDWRLIKCYVVF